MNSSVNVLTMSAARRRIGRRVGNLDQSGVAGPAEPRHRQRPDSPADSTFLSCRIVTGCGTGIGLADIERCASELVGQPLELHQRTGVHLGVKCLVVFEIELLHHTCRESLRLKDLGLGPHVVLHEPTAGHLRARNLLKRHDLRAVGVDLKTGRGLIHRRGGEDL